MADEVTQATSTGWQQVDLGRRIPRIETAAILLVAMVWPLAPSP
jgi:16S rRNA U1498 N3-methylase RsmE